MAPLDIQVDRGDAPLVPFLEKYALPERFTARVTPREPDLPICHLSLAVEGGRVICEDLRLERKPGAAPLSGALLRRVPVAEYVRGAVDQVGHWRIQATGPLTIHVGGGSYSLPTEPVDAGHLATPIAGTGRTKHYKAASRAPRELGRVTDETLREVAEIYRTAHARGKPPTRAVMERWYVSRSTASRWVKRARQAGVLGPALPRMAGEGPGA